MARFANFDEAVAIVQENDRVSAASLARALGATSAAAASLLDRLHDEGHIEGVGEDGWHRVIGTQARRRWDRNGSSVGTPSGRIAMLEAENAELRHKLREVEDRLAHRGSTNATGQHAPSQAPETEDEMAQTRRRLRHLLARALHPDRAEGNVLERNLHTDLFKRLWPEIEAAISGKPSPSEEE
ncbi:hypothetical protein [Plastoroseomonas arctica]|uniref:FtsK gamma domain-containing protein n=1 Tax=Plastoroseomonas arctica TaxID=1509237 RepID=A0AAF1KUV3_9PROT|nr:hypothetical protein [Plastoroseomonas arctica]MBR0657147.1 hypothetical protein [Plastoroseomonas arctica]